MDFPLFLIENLPPVLEILFLLLAALFWYKRYFSLKQAEAFFGFYARLSLLLNCLHERLEEKGLLEISDPQRGNVYTLMYDEKTQNEECPGLCRSYLNDLEHIEYLAGKIEHALIESDANVYPRNTEKKEWYQNQRVIFAFCNFIRDKGGSASTSIARENENSEYKHINKCRELISAISSIQKSIENQKY